MTDLRELLRECRPYVELNDNDDRRMGDVELNLLKRIDAALSQPEQGMVMVPMEPTIQMNLVGEHWLQLRDKYSLNGCEAQHVWRAMLDAARSQEGK